jgi:hypothetical protein
MEVKSMKRLNIYAQMLGRAIKERYDTQEERVAAVDRAIQDIKSWLRDFADRNKPN